VVIQAINQMRREHLEHKDDNSSEEEDVRQTEIIIEKAGRQVKRNFPFEIDWSKQRQR
jgi:uncharacterized protein (UPF0305 family)